MPGIFSRAQQETCEGQFTVACPISRVSVFQAPLLCSTSVRVITASLKGSRHWEGGWGTFLQAGVGLDAPSNLCCAVSMAEHSQGKADCENESSAAFTLHG